MQSCGGDLEEGWYATAKTRPEGASKQMDVYYFSPDGKKLRWVLTCRPYLAWMATWRITSRSAGLAICQSPDFAAKQALQKL